MNKIVFSLAWIGIFILSIFGIGYVIIPKMIHFNLTSFTNKIILLNVSLVYFLVTIYKFSSLFKRTKDYEIITKNGKIIISTSSIKTFVLQTLEKDKDISIISVVPYRKGSKFNLKIELDLLNNTKLAEKIAEVQKKLQEAGKNELGIDINTISLKVVKIKNIEVH